ncbi:MAG: hypothetical protein CMK23_08715 [Porticoccaceae bacterium]|nr:hypothetical protein [Porticoccaceae bacterium]
MKISKSLKLILSGLSNFIKKKSSLLLFLLLFPTPSSALSQAEHTFIRQIDYCLSQLYKRIDEDRHIDRQIIIAMASLESNYGRSRFALEGYNFFGIRTNNLDRPHIKPKGYKNPNFGLIKFKHFCESVNYTVWTLNDHPAHKKFSKSKNVNDLINWATDPDYIKKIKERIKTHSEKSHN